MNVMDDSEKPNADQYPTQNSRPPKGFGDYLNGEILDDYDICNNITGPLTH